MALQADSFVDHYALLECSSTASLTDLKRAYFEKLREFHPDKRPGSAGGEGRRVTQALNEAWAILKDPAKRECYDALWRQQHEAKQPKGEAAEQAKAQQANPQAEQRAAQTARAAQQAQPERSAEERADDFRREGNELYRTAVSAAKQHGAGNLFGVAMALQKYQDAIEKYSQGIELHPHSHLLQNNRALCYAALKDWQKCRMDALRVTMLKPDFMKGWFLLVKSLWMLGSGGEALRELDTALKILPGNPDLVLLQRELQHDVEGLSSRFPQDENGISRTVSPACTPPACSPACGSRAPTPPPLHRPEPPQPHLPGLSKRRPSPEPPPEPPEAEDGRGVTGTFGCTPQTGRSLNLPGAVPNDGTPPPMPRKGSSTVRIPAHLRQGMQEFRQGIHSRQHSRSPQTRPDSTEIHAGPAFFPDTTETFGTPEKPCSVGARRRPSPEPNSNGTWSCNQVFPTEETASFGPARAARATERSPGRLHLLQTTRSSSAFGNEPKKTAARARSQSSFDGNQSCGPAFFKEANNSSAQQLPLPGQADLSHTFGSLPCTKPASQRSLSLASRHSEPPKPAVTQSDGKSLREVILFGARAYSGKGGKQQ